MLPKLPIPPLRDTCDRYLRVLKPLQNEAEHRRTKRVVSDFLKNPKAGDRLHNQLLDYASNRSSYIEEFWYESYLNHSQSIVLNLNPFFILEDDPTPSRGNQLTRAASLILASIGFIHDQRTLKLEPDRIRGKDLDMYQYSKLFGSARIPTRHGCKIKTDPKSKHLVIIRRGQFYWFNIIDDHHRPVLNENQLLKNLKTIISDADKTPNDQLIQSSIGILTTETRPTWARLREDLLQNSSTNLKSLEVIDSSLFVLCLDSSSPKNADEMSESMLSGTYQLNRHGVQVGTCINRWYDKLQIIVCANGQAGVNFEHSAVDGHTVLRFVGDVYTELIVRFANSINPKCRTLFHIDEDRSKQQQNLQSTGQNDLKMKPKRLLWELSTDLKNAIRFAETRLSDLICQNEVLALEFSNYGKNFITSMNISPDAFVQMAFQVCYFSLYGRVESTYEPAMTKSFHRGRTEGIRTVSEESTEFVKKFCSSTVDDQQKVQALRKACKYHQELTRECSNGLGQDRILFAMYSLAKLEIERSSLHSSSSSSSSSEDEQYIKNRSRRRKKKLPKIFRDPGYGLLNHSVLSTSNCGNPSLRLFGFGPVVQDGYGIGYIIKDEGLSFVISSKNLQNKRFRNILRSYLIEIKNLLIKTSRTIELKNESVDIRGIYELNIEEKKEEVVGLILDCDDDFNGHRCHEGSKSEVLEQKLKKQGKNDELEVKKQIKDDSAEIDEDFSTYGYGFFVSFVK
ncbi:choline acetyltransferase [Phakopsora pachyrhizi]|uniref:Choline acetyltransferase n=1 Tax=Phakopsora pachyrhizi TaxID=170000 RepID=A0AAV0BC25_PHAPC|nr:choline acetyltransferase [Phakopsora pachyrhizi]CAH7684772.1 choline acetyltransferase [Phakopsora pachyrhizi]